jgi:hypothetical protein
MYRPKVQESESQGENSMPKEKKARKKSEGRTPTLAPYVDTIGGKTIYMNSGGKEYIANVLSSGVIRMDDKDYTSPSSAAGAILGKNKKGKQLQTDGWRVWRFNKDGERVELNELRGKSSPLKAVAKAKRKPKAVKKARKPRASKPKPQAPAAEMAASA